MKTISVRTEIHAKPPLGRADWLEIALDTLVNEGINAVQITRLARVLDVTRGSFYWHFDSRADLLQAMLREWRAANGEAFKETFSRCESLDESILCFFRIWVDESQFSPELDQAVRDWARLDDNVLDTVRKEDNERLTAIANEFLRFGFLSNEAEVRARVLYFSQVGYAAMNLGEAMNERLALLSSYYTAYTGRVLAPETAEEFKSRLQNRP